MSKNVIDFNDATFKSDVLESEQPVLVDFWAEWCGPCKMLTPTINELADEYIGRIVIGKVNVDQNPITATEYGIRSIPCLLFFNNGKVLNQIMGAVSKKEILAALDEIMK